MHRMIRRVKGDEQGASAVLVGLMIFVLIGFGAVAVDVGAMYSERAQLQNAADAGALAAAQYCAKNSDCTSPSAQAGARTAALTVTGGNLIGSAPTVGVLAFTTNTVKVPTATLEMAHPLAAALGFAQSDVGTDATAKWVPGTKGPVVPWAIGHCSIPTSGSGTVAWIPIDNVTCPGFQTGGFGWLDDGTASCSKDVALNDFVTITTGNTGKCSVSNAELAAAVAQLGCNLAGLPNSLKSNEEKMFACLVGKTIYVPVYNSATACAPLTPPAGKTYCIDKFAVFEVSGIHVKDNGSDQVDYCSPKTEPFYNANCDNKKDPTRPKDWGSLAFYGRFIEYTTVNPNWFVGPTVPVTSLID
ncbi:pilus assembly protein TadG-related protein [Agromyces sp. NPDC057679]|uniref:pilus assembly protein TadG-related protein n=1 Tax=Agromyces sp. NPDC057679 TaxID=3346207 RepID=UPI00366F9FFA